MTCQKSIKNNAGKIRFLRLFGILLQITASPGIYALCEWTKGVGDRRYHPGGRAWILEAGGTTRKY